MIHGLSFDALLADKAFDSNWIIDEEMYKWRHLVENVFCDLKDCRRIALRTDKTAPSFAAITNACAALLNSK